MITHGAIERLAFENSSDQAAADNARAILDASGQRSMRVDKMLRLIGAANVAGAEAAVGPSGRVPLSNVSRLPEHQQRDFLLLRGRLPEVAPIPLATLKQRLTTQALQAIDDGTARKISGVPSGIRGVRPTVERVSHPASNTHFDVYVVRNVVWISRASPVPSPLVGFWRIGAAPSP